METNSNFNQGNIQNEGNPFTKKITEEVKIINEITFKNFAHKWAYTNSFFPVLRLIEHDKIYIKIYYKKTISNDIRQLEELLSTYYRENFQNLNYSQCNILRISFHKNVKKEEIIKCESMDDLERIHLKSLEPKDELYDLPHKIIGSCTLYMLYVERQFKYWNKLIKKGYLEDEYEQNCLKSDNSNIEAKSQDINKQVHLYQKTSESQPTSLNPKIINGFFIENYSKDWAMRLGYTSTFIKYENGELCFNIISDPRFSGQNYYLAKEIASTYSKNVNLLSGANYFVAKHFFAKDIIGFLISSSDINLINQYQERIKKSYAELPKEPNLIHYGSLRN